MRVVQYVWAAAIVAAVSATATAQTNAPDPTAVPAAVAAAAQAPPATTQADNWGLIQSHWTAAGFIGSNVGNVAGDPSFRDHGNVTVGGQIGYLWHGVVGAEFLGDAAPSFKSDALLLSNNPHLFTYMANGIGAVPLGPSGNVQPYGSGGFGFMQLSANVITLADDKTLTTSSNHEALGGWNLGGGIMAFAGPVGIRGDFRYYKANTSNLTSGTFNDLYVKALLSGIGFWRTNVGVAFRW